MLGPRPPRRLIKSMHYVALLFQEKEWINNYIFVLSPTEKLNSKIFEKVQDLFS